MALKVNETVRVEVEASDGQILKENDAIMLRVNRRTKEDIVCRFAGISNGYFVTTTLDGQHVNKYRQGSIGEDGSRDSRRGSTGSSRAIIGARA